MSLTHTPDPMIYDKPPEEPYFAVISEHHPHYPGALCLVAGQKMHILQKGYEGDTYSLAEMPHHWPVDSGTISLHEAEAALAAVRS